MAEKENFYHELDTKTKHSFCTCQTLAIGLVLLALIAAGGLTYAARKIMTAVAPNRTVTATRNDAVKLREKVSQLSVTPGASTSLTITEAELTSVIAEAVAASPNFPLRGVQAEIDPDNIILTGTATKYLNTSVAVTLQPKVVDGKAKFELVKIQAGSLAVPALLTDMIAKGLEDILTNQMTQLQNITVKTMTLGEGQMTVTGTISS